jgi:hypothetical protein
MHRGIYTYGCNRIYAKLYILVCLVGCMENNHNTDAVMHMLGYLEAHHWEDALKNYDIKGLEELRNHNNEYWGLE